MFNYTYYLTSYYDDKNHFIDSSKYLSILTKNNLHYILKSIRPTFLTKNSPVITRIYVVPNEQVKTFKQSTTLSTSYQYIQFIIDYHAATINATLYFARDRIRLESIDKCIMVMIMNDISDKLRTLKAVFDKERKWLSTIFETTLEYNINFHDYITDNIKLNEYATSKI